jgi:hypothetical protein
VNVYGVSVPSKCSTEKVMQSFVIKAVVFSLHCYVITFRIMIIISLCNVETFNMIELIGHEECLYLISPLTKLNSKATVRSHYIMKAYILNLNCMTFQNPVGPKIVNTDCVHFF